MPFASVAAAPMALEADMLGGVSSSIPSEGIETGINEDTEGEGQSG